MDEEAARQIVGMWAAELGENELSGAEQAVSIKLLREIALDVEEFLPLADDRLLLLTEDRLLILEVDRDRTRATVTYFELTPRAVQPFVGVERLSESRAGPWFRFVSPNDRFAPIELHFAEPDPNKAMRERFGRSLAIKLGLPTVFVGLGG
jgi:hypothetical protein